MNKLHLFTAVLTALTLAGCSGKQAPASQRTVRVKVQKIGAVQVHGERGYSGTIEAENGVSLSFATAGTIRSVAVDEGQMVRQGQLIATLDGTDQGSTLASSHAVTQQAVAALRQAQDNYNRARKLHEGGVISDSKWVEAQNALAGAREAVKSAQALENIARKGNRDTRLVAPYAGYISRKVAETGQNVAPGEMVAELVHINKVKVKVSVPEGEIDRITKGEEMMVYCEAAAGATVYGRVVEKGVSADPLTRTYEVKLLVDNPQLQLLPGMVCNVYSRYTRGQTSVFVPAEVIQLETDNRMFVWIVKNGRATKRYINYLSDTDQGVRVSGGLEPGDALIVAGQQKVSEGTRCTII